MVMSNKASTIIGASLIISALILGSLIDFDVIIKAPGVIVEVEK